MRRVQPYPDLAAALADLDNGGRIWNFFSFARDDKITPAELARASGTFGTEASALVYYALAAWGLPAEQRAELDAKLAPSLARSYRELAPRVVDLLPDDPGLAGQGAIATGVLAPLDDAPGPGDSVVGACARWRDIQLLVPITAGELTTFLETPIVEVVRVCCLTTDQGVIPVAIERAAIPPEGLPTGRMRVGGRLRRTQSPEISALVLDGEFYTPIAD